MAGDMAGRTRGERWWSSPAIDLFHDPLASLRAEHERQQRFCDRLEALADTMKHRPATAEASKLLEYLTVALPLHVEDEERDLLPALRRRCRAEDGLPAILARLQEDHVRDGALAGAILAELELIGAGMTTRPAAHFFTDVRAFAEAQRRHLAWENRLILPLAERRLTEEDLAAITTAMAARRGSDVPGL